MAAFVGTIDTPPAKVEASKSGNADTKAPPNTSVVNQVIQRL